ncbi:response regulator transcription factor [Paenibacillus sp. TRM 82003]|uniref:sigma factor-like helix-turn-helix DNA-binding protein n=1 Tax=Kineococcus sp. TRM81007 TaxID=2925831 RepID=UPI001F5765EA|nr:response regulator transcription factor [Kineococcus sp. TRM81007]MCI2238391.1 response regulator transcription factor [Kineococcus sp. TRM81007]MCI3922095.1 response regulator transcription factor [Paenibacillus sp. TRM 82003]
MEQDPAPTASGAALRVAAVDDHPALLTGLRVELAGHGVQLVATAPTVPELLRALGGDDADGTGSDGTGGDGTGGDGTGAAPVVLLDLRLGDGSRPADNVGALRGAGSRVLVYTEGRQHAEASEALRAGAQGVLLKDRPVATLAEALRAVADGETLPSAETAAALQGDADLAGHLSPQERRVLELYAGGMPARSVALRLGVTLETAKSYLKRIRAKYAALDRPAYTRMELYRRAVEDGVLSPLPPAAPPAAPPGAGAPPPGR